MFNDFLKHCAQSQLADLCEKLLDLAQQSFCVKNANIAKWRKALEAIQTQPKGILQYKNPYLSIDANKINKNTLEQALKQLRPWRKGPYKIANLTLDSEWRGDMKWHRLMPHIKPLQGRSVLDVGAGNGYFTYLMALSGAKLALGIEPFLLFNYQFQAIYSLINNPPNAFVLPLRLEQMPNAAVFDTVFSMGVLYHQKEHIAHLQKLKKMLANAGQLVLETLVIDAQHGQQIIPKHRYAKMRNVYCLPSIETLQTWLFDAGFNDVKLADVSQTTVEEQHATHWIGDNAQSLKDFLHPNNANLTIEGLPAPKRALFICHK